MIAAISLAFLLFVPGTNPAATISTATIAIYEDSELKQGRQAFTTGDYQRAIEILKPYVEKKQKSFDGYLYLGLSYRELRRFDEAIAMFEKAVAIKPKLARAHFELGKAYLAAKNYDAAVKEYQWLRQQKKDSWLADEFRLSIPAEVAKRYQLPPSSLEERQADLDAAQPILPISEALRPTVIYKERANYTEEARSHHTQGTVALKIIFSKQGKLLVIGVVRGLPDGLTKMAIDAARKIRFSPAMKDGQPVSVSSILEFNFNLN